MAREKKTLLEKKRKLDSETAAGEMHGLRLRSLWIIPTAAVGSLDGIISAASQGKAGFLVLKQCFSSISGSAQASRDEPEGGGGRGSGGDGRAARPAGGGGGRESWLTAAFPIENLCALYANE